MKNKHKQTQAMAFLIEKAIACVVYGEKGKVSCSEKDKDHPLPAGESAPRFWAVFQGIACPSAGGFDSKYSRLSAPQESGSFAACSRRYTLPQEPPLCQPENIIDGNVPVLTVSSGLPGYGREESESAECGDTGLLR